MRINLTIIFLFILQSISSQEKDIFQVEINQKEKSEFMTDYSSFKHKFEYLYEDDIYTVKDSCRGEFGGVIEFKNKKTNKIYVAKATCPSSLIKINGKYYLTTSLAHMSGFSGIYEISDPEKMAELKSTDSEKEKYYKKKSDSGLKELYKNIGGTILVSFPYKDELFFITSDSDGAYLTKRQASELIKIKKLLDYRVYTYETSIKITNDNHYVNKFQVGYGKKVGFFDIDDNVITINIYE